MEVKESGSMQQPGKLTAQIRNVQIRILSLAKLTEIQLRQKGSMLKAFPTTEHPSSF
jgi:hypothetical protein